MPAWPPSSPKTSTVTPAIPGDFGTREFRRVIGRSRPRSSRSGRLVEVEAHQAHVLQAPELLNGLPFKDAEIEVST